MLAKLSAIGELRSYLPTVLKTSHPGTYAAKKDLGVWITKIRRQGTSKYKHKTTHTKKLLGYIKRNMRFILVTAARCRLLISGNAHNSDSLLNLLLTLMPLSDV